jgi:ribonuclease HI
MTAASKTPPPKSKPLFTEPDYPSGIYTANVDGAARGNPGPAAYGVVLRTPDGTLLESLGKKLGVQTNNVAEYHALIAALDYAEAHGIRRLRVRSDSLLVVQQMKGSYKVKRPALKPLHETASRLSRAFEYFTIEHIPRERNAEADALANAALDAPASGPGGTTFRSASSAGSSPARTNAAGPKAGAAKPVLARYSGGALHPLEPLAIAEGEEVEIIIRRNR